MAYPDFDDIRRCDKDEDCNLNQICENRALCVCKPNWIGKDCQYPDPCANDNPCLNEGICVPIEEDGSYYCDCPKGYIHPHCERQDLCAIEGNHACQHGSTCVNLSDDPYEYVCKCRIPYVGEFCESYNLCEIEMEECIEDLDVDSPTDESICYPCVLNANCTQLSIREYSCSCVAGMNHSNCLAANYDKSNSLKTPSFSHSRNDIAGGTDWNPVIPTIASTCFGLYILFMIILLIIRRNRSQQRPKLIVCCDIHEFDNNEYYLISVETGNKWGGGTGCNVFCFLCGENGNAGPFPLNDANLREVKVLQKGQEDNYLVSHANDIGRVDKIVISYDDEHRRHDSWFCERITVRNVKADKNWFFFISANIQPRRAVRTYEYLVASSEYVKKWNTVSISGRHYKHQLAKHHAFISPFLHFTEQRITLVFAEIMMYMLALIVLYGFLLRLDSDFYSNGEYVPSLIVLINGSIAAACCFAVGIILAICFEFKHTRRIPTLIVWRNRPGMPEDAEIVKEGFTPLEDEEEIEEIVEEVLPLKDKRMFIDKATNTDPMRPPKIKKIKRKKQVRVPVLIKHRERPPQIVRFHKQQFRIPSTNILRTERWISDNAAGTSGPEDLVDDSLVHDVTTFGDRIPTYMYSATDITSPQQERQNHLRRTENSLDLDSTSTSEAHPTSSKSDLEEESFQMVEVEVSEEEIVSDENLISPDENNVASSKMKPKAEPGSTATIFTSSQPLLNPASKHEPTSTFASGDSPHVTKLQKRIVKKKQVKQKSSPTNLKVYCELVEMDCKKYVQISGRKKFVVLGWILCLGAIIAATVVCCFYGRNYGYQKTYNWIISLAICWTENFIFYQFIKVFILVLVVTCLVNQKKLSSFEAEKIRRRFQVCNLDGLTVLPETFKLQFIQYLPKYWIPAPHIKLPKD